MLSLERKVGSRLPSVAEGVSSIQNPEWEMACFHKKGLFQSTHIKNYVARGVTDDNVDWCKLVD